MTKNKQIEEIQKRLPNDIKIVDGTKFDFTEDEFLGILCWIKYFNHHYEQFGKNEYPKIMFPIISKRLRLDFGLYRVKSDCDPFKDCYNIYISEIGNNSPNKIRLQSVKYLMQYLDYDL